MILDSSLSRDGPERVGPTVEKAFVSEVSDRIINLAETRYGTLAEFARVAGVNYQTVKTLQKSGNLNKARFETVVRIAHELDIEPYSIITEKLVFRDKLMESVEVPLYGAITAGAPGEMDDQSELYPIPAELHERYPEAFLLRVAGRSMDRVIPNGSYALVNPCTTADNPHAPYAVAVNRDAATLKYVRALETAWSSCPTPPTPPSAPSCSTAPTRTRPRCP